MLLSHTALIWSRESFFKKEILESYGWEISHFIYKTLNMLSIVAKSKAFKGNKINITAKEIIFCQYEVKKLPLNPASHQEVL